MNEKMFDAEGDYDIKLRQDNVTERKKRKGSGKRFRVISSSLRGKYVRACMPKGKVYDIAFDATLRAAAPYQRERKREDTALCLKIGDLRQKVRQKRTGNHILFIVDASGSMAAQKRMNAAKGVVLSILQDSYQKRDKVAMIAFRKDSAQTLLGFTSSVELAYKKLKDLPTGGRTPLASAIYKGYNEIKAAKYKDPDIVPYVIVITDGRTNVCSRGNDPLKDALEAAHIIAKEQVKVLVVDTEKGFVKLGIALRLAQAMDAEYVKVEDIEKQHLENIVRSFVV